MIKKIVSVWDNDGLIYDNVKFLNQKTKQVHLPAGTSTKEIIQDLLDTYSVIPCAGIAANQIGYNKRIFVGMKELLEDDDVDDIEEQEARHTEANGNPNADNYEIYINPRIDVAKNAQCDVEGCLSVPEVQMTVHRSEKIKVRYYTTNGHVVKKTLTGFMSKLFQHELDHLDGRLMIDNQVEEVEYLNNAKKEQLADLYKFWKTLS